MNSEIEKIFKNFSVQGKLIPVSFLRYDGKETTYVTYQEVFVDETFSGDDSIISFVDCYDFDIFSKGNYSEVVKAVKEKLEANDWTYFPQNDSGDLYEDDTGFFHKTLNFGYIRNGG